MGIGFDSSDRAYLEILAHCMPPSRPSSSQDSELSFMQNQ